MDGFYAENLKYLVSLGGELKLLAAQELQHCQDGRTGRLIIGKDHSLGFIKKSFKR